MGRLRGHWLNRGPVQLLEARQQAESDSVRDRDTFRTGHPTGSQGLEACPRLTWAHLPVGDLCSPDPTAVPEGERPVLGGQVGCEASSPAVALCLPAQGTRVWVSLSSEKPLGAAGCNMLCTR